jgi:hypothetical protein
MPNPQPARGTKTTLGESPLAPGNLSGWRGFYAW